MALLLRKAFESYFWLMNDLRDKRADIFPMMSSPVGVVIIVGVYLWFVQKWGPEFMKNRKPYQLEGIMRVYNIFQVFINAYLVIAATPALLKLDINCSPVDFSDNPEAVHILKLSYVYFLIKVSDLLDTVFFILRKKMGQATFLHIYHHAAMAIISWFGVKFIGGGHSIYFGYVNAIVHTVMYFYYFLTSLSDQYKKNIWWKKYITQLQLIQFVLLLVIYGRVALHPDCGYPKYALYIFLPQDIFMLFMFGDFYVRAYIMPKKGTQNGKSK